MDMGSIPYFLKSCGGSAALLRKVCTALRCTIQPSEDEQGKRMSKEAWAYYKSVAKRIWPDT